MPPQYVSSSTDATSLRIDIDNTVCKTGENCWKGSCWFEHLTK